MSVTKTITDLIKVSIETQMNTFISVVSEKYEINQDELIEMFKDIGKETLATSKKATKKTKSKTPKPRSAWLMFSGETGRLIRENPDDYDMTEGFKFGDVTKKCGELWRGMDDDEKAPWQEKADEYNTEHIDETPTKKKKVSNPSPQRGQKKSAKKTKTAYQNFMEKNKKLVKRNLADYELEEDASKQVILKTCRDMWNELDSEEKNQWTTERLEDGDSIETTLDEIEEEDEEESAPKKRSKKKARGRRG